MTTSEPQTQDTRSAKAALTPGPWAVTRHGILVGAADEYIAIIAGQPNQQANANYIVRACNSHADLLAALEAIAARSARAPVISGGLVGEIHKLAVDAVEGAGYAVSLAKGEAQ
jgi:hypothetical protein